MSVIRQVFCSLIASLLGLMIGVGLSWPAYTTNMFMGNDTVLSRPMTTSEVSLFGSLSSIGAFISIPLAGYLLDKIGRKWILILAGIPFLITWCIITLSSSVELVIFAMFLSGIGGIGQMVSPLYIGEVAQDSIRGALTSFFTVAFFTGVLASYIFSGYLSYEQNAYVQISISVIYTVLIAFVKETPIYYCKVGNYQAAAESLSYFKNLPANSKEIQSEIHRLKFIVSPGEVLDLPERELLSPGEKVLQLPQKSEELKGFKFFWHSKSSKRGLWLCMSLLSASLSMGMVILQVYAEYIFMKLMPSYKAEELKMFPIFLAVTMLLAGVAAALITDVVGRKSLMILSSLASTILTLLIGFLAQYPFGPDWLPAAIIYIFTFLFNFGAGSIPYVLIAEVFLPEVKGFCNTVCIECGWLVNFVILYTFLPLVEIAGLSGTFYLCSAISLVSTLISYFLLPETKGMPVEAIQLLFNPKEYPPKPSTG